MNLACALVIRHCPTATSKTASVATDRIRKCRTTEPKNGSGPRRHSPITCFDLISEQREAYEETTAHPTSLASRITLQQWCEQWSLLTLLLSPCSLRYNCGMSIDYYSPYSLGLAHYPTTVVWATVITHPTSIALLITLQLWYEQWSLLTLLPSPRSLHYNSGMSNDN